MENTLFPLTEHFVPSYKNKVFFSAETKCSVLCARKETVDEVMRNCELLLIDLKSMDSTVHQTFCDISFAGKRLIKSIEIPDIPAFSFT